MRGLPGFPFMGRSDRSVPAPRSAGFNPFRFLRRVVVFGFAVIQLVLVLRILIDLDVIPADSGFSAFVIPWSDRVAAPVQRAGGGLSGLFGGGDLGGLGSLFGLSGMLGGGQLFGAPGGGFNVVIVTALIGWSVVEGLIMRVVSKFESI